MSWNNWGNDTRQPRLPSDSIFQFVYFWEYFRFFISEKKKYTYGLQFSSFHLITLYSSEKAECVRYLSCTLWNAWDDWKTTHFALDIYWKVGKDTRTNFIQFIFLNDSRKLKEKNILMIWTERLILHSTGVFLEVSP